MAKDMELVDTQHTTICFLINPRSGGRRGAQVLEEIENSQGKGFYGESIAGIDINLFQDSSSNEYKEASAKLLHQLVLDQSPEKLSESNINRVIVIGGGDGTQKWGMEIIDSLQIPKGYKPSLAILPLGTANELARVTGWKISVGKRRFSLKKYISYILKGDNISVDTWDVTTTIPSSESSEAVTSIKSSMICFASVGIDAKVALKFDDYRNQHPSRANGVLKNKSIYFWYGMKRMFSKTKPLQDNITVQADGEELTFPVNLQSLQIFNISTAADGINFWSNQKSTKKELQDPLRPSLSDGLLEVCGLRNILHLTNVKMFLSHSFRLSQSKVIRLSIKQGPVALQIDGETCYLETGTTVDFTLRERFPVISGPKCTINIEPDERLLK